MRAMQSHDILTPVWGKRLVKAKKFTDCVTKNITDSQSTNNSKCFRTVQCNSDIYKNSILSKDNYRLEPFGRGSSAL